MKTIIYTRVSTTQQSENGHSLRNQLHKLNQYCELNNLRDITVITEIKSGKNISGREGFQRLIEGKTFLLVSAEKITPLLPIKKLPLNLVFTFGSKEEKIK